MSKFSSIYKKKDIKIFLSIKIETYYRQNIKAICAFNGDCLKN